MFYQNCTNTVQGFYVDRQLIQVRPKEIISDSTGYSFINQYPDIFKPLPSLYQYLLENPEATISIHRNFALGDVIMMYGVCLYILKKFPRCKVIFSAPSIYLELVSSTTVNNRLQFKCTDNPIITDYTMSMNSILEKDHSSPTHAKYHRMNIALIELGFPLEELPMSGEEIPWDVWLGNDAYNFADAWFSKNIPSRSKTVSSKSKKDHIFKYKLTVAIQVKGSGPMKSLNPDTVKYIAEKLSDYIDVILIDYNGLVQSKKEHVHILSRTNIRYVAAVIKKCQALICMDSGLLWVAHLTQTPTICILGPTPSIPRIGLFPDKNKVFDIRTEELFNCTPCNERAERCNKQYQCIQSANKDYLLEQIQKYLYEIIKLKIMNQISKDYKVKPVLDDIKKNEHAVINISEKIIEEYAMNTTIIPYEYAKVISTIIPDISINDSYKVYDYNGKLYDLKKLKYEDDLWVEVENNKYEIYDPTKFIIGFSIYDLHILLNKWPFEKIDKIVKEIVEIKAVNKEIQELIQETYLKRFKQEKNVSSSF